MASHIEPAPIKDTSEAQLSPTYYRREAHTHGHERTSTISGKDGKAFTETESQRNSGGSPDHLTGPGSMYEDDERVEYPPMPEDQKLGYISTGSLIISNMVGTGVFAKAPYILENCGSKGVSLLLWVVGGAMTFCGLLIYIELGIAFPFNGAEVVYVRIIFSSYSPLSNKVLTPGLLIPYRPMKPTQSPNS